MGGLRGCSAHGCLPQSTDSPGQPRKPIQAPSARSCRDAGNPVPMVTGCTGQRALSAYSVPPLCPCYRWRTLMRRPERLSPFLTGPCTGGLILASRHPHRESWPESSFSSCAPRCQAAGLQGALGRRVRVPRPSRIDMLFFRGPVRAARMTRTHLEKLHPCWFYKLETRAVAQTWIQPLPCGRHLLSPAHQLQSLRERLAGRTAVSLVTI